VLIVPGRASRPGAMGRTTPVAPAADCPFCEGHESLTPPEVDADPSDGRRPDTPDWLIRVVPNKFPAQPGQEVVVHGPVHATSVLATAPGILERALAMWNRRRRAMLEGGAAYVLAGINEGAGAGASLPHSHSQIIPFGALPPFASVAAQAFAGACPICPLTAEGGGVVDRGEGLIALAPPWARMPYETWIVPERHDGLVDDPAALARAARGLLARLTALLGEGLSWNGALVQEPAIACSWHWRFEVTPRITVPGLIELAAGIWVNVVDPLRAAEDLRSASMPSPSRQ
jgi:UDPglucose--hexose-1-phosphate uridylyltransferase